jgi:hypothetical protein
MNKITLTTRGKEILSQNTLQGGEVYWVGYFGLAYVPDQGGFSADQTRLISDTEHGDYIYNLWQGDLVNEGHSIQGDLDSNYSSAAKQISKLTLYDRNITSNFRYMYDEENDRNRMVTWVSGQNSTNSADSETSSYVRDGYRIYNGITMGDSHNTDDMKAESELPCPAPLFYAGGSVSYGNPLDKGDFVNSVVSNDWPLVKEGETEAGAYPRVTPDMRFYGGSWKGGSKSDDWKWIPEAAGKYDTIPSATTRNSEDTPASADCLDQYAEFISVSNFNKDHGHVSSEGYGVGYQESCHNMSMVTKLFPIANYELTATSDPATTDRNITERGSAKSIKYVIRLNLKAAYQGVKAYLDTLDYKKTDTDGIEQSDIDLYTSTKPNSFKFNRIGIYAVRVTIRHFYKEGDAGNHTDCRATHYQMEISPDAKPELFAVMQVDEVCMSEDGSFGLGDYNTTFVLNLENAPENTDLCTNPEVYYNLVENEAITWYQNQLIATAGLSEAVTNLGVNVAYLMNNLGKGGTGNCYGSDSDGTQYASSDHTHDYLKNLVDDYCKDGSVRDIMSANPQADPVPPLDKVSGGWSCGLLSFTMGDQNATLGDYSLNMSVRGAIDAESKHILLVGGRKELENDDEKYVVVRNSDYSFIMGTPGEYSDIHNSIVMGGDLENQTDTVLGATNSLLLGSGNVSGKTVIIDSIINTTGASIEEDDSQNYVYPDAIQSSIYIGTPLFISGMADTGSREIFDTDRSPMKDIFLFVGTNNDISDSVYKHWLGRGEFPGEWYASLTGSGTSEQIKEITTPEDLTQPYDAPMIFTGGIALGGHMVLGYETSTEQENRDYYTRAGSYGLLKLGSSYNYTFIGSSNHFFYENTKNTIVMPASSPWKIYKPGGPYYTAGGHEHYHDIIRVYSNQMNNGHSPNHWLIHSPHAGKPIISTEMQELDGTLHIGLGQDYMHGNSGGVTDVSCSYVGASVRLTIRYQDEDEFYLDVVPDKNYTTTTPRYATFKAGYDESEMYETAGDSSHYFVHQTSGLSVRCQYHYEPLGTDAYDMVIDEFTVRISPGRPNIHSFRGTANDRNIKYAEGIYPLFVIDNSTNITDTNCFLCDGWNLFGQTKRLVRFVAAKAIYYGATGEDAIGTIGLNPGAVVELDRGALYRFSALNYRQQNTEKPSTIIPMSMEKIPITSTYNYLEVDGTPYVP